MPWRKPWLKKSLYGIAIFVVAVFALDWWFNPSVPTLDAQQIASVEIHLFNEKYTSPKAGQAASLNVITDVSVIRRLLSVFAAAERGSEHKGVTSGKVILCRKDGGREELGILPGFRDNRYEYRYGGRINHVDRVQFLEVLESVGILSVALISHQ